MSFLLFKKTTILFSFLRKNKKNISKIFGFKINKITFFLNIIFNNWLFLKKIMFFPELFFKKSNTTKNFFFCFLGNKIKIHCLCL